MKEYFSKIGFVLAAVGSAIGLGNIWRFPYMVGQNGGGSFLVAYFFAIILVGLPIMLLELNAGKKYKSSFLKTYEKINPKLKYVALLSLFVSFVVLSYYLVVNGWSIAYTFFTFTKYPSFDVFANNSFIAFFVAFLITFFIIHKGIKKGIERFVKIAMPLLFIIILGLTIYAFTLKGFLPALKFYLMPNWAYLFKIKTWILAFGQALFSLSVGSGIMITYASHFKKDITKPAYYIVLADTLIAIISGLFIFPIVFTFNIKPDSGVGLAFNSLPNIFVQNIFLKVVGFLFFLLLSIAALTSAISMLELVISSLTDFLKISRRNITWISSLIIFVLGSIFSLNVALLSKADLWFGSFALIVQSLTLVLILSWLGTYRKDLFFYIGKYITPIILTILIFFAKTL